MSELIKYLLFEDDGGDDMAPVSELSFNEDGSYSFVVENEITGAKFKHTIKTEEV